MSIDGTYSGLCNSVADFLNRGDLASVIPDFVVLAEAQMMRRLVGRVRQGLPIPRRLVLRVNVSVAPGAEFVAVPADFCGPVEFVLAGSPEIVLDYLDPANFQQWKETNGLAGMAPQFYTVVGSEFRIFPAADKAYAAELTYIQRLAAASTATNFILTDYPDAYLYGALTASAPYLKDDTRTTVWGALFTAAVDDICNADPIPGDKSTLRTEFAQLRRMGGRYDINSDI